jgi:hypothetical protein
MTNKKLANLNYKQIWKDKKNEGDGIIDVQYFAEKKYVNIDKYTIKYSEQRDKNEPIILIAINTTFAV